MTTSYNGQFPGPTWVVCPGDALDVNVQNDWTLPTTPGTHPGETNLHTHGFHVSPHGPSDNIFVARSCPGGDFQYQYKLPRDHPPGAYWYHPHLHGQTNPQVFAGMAGGIIVQGGLDGDPEYATHSAPDDLVSASSRRQPAPTGRVRAQRPRRGAAVHPDGPRVVRQRRAQPEIPIEPGELQRWRIYNACAGAFVKLQLDRRPFQILARDGNYVDHKDRKQVMHRALLTPRGPRPRRTARAPTSSSTCRSTPTRTFTQPQQTLATVVSRGRHGRRPEDAAATSPTWRTCATTRSTSATS